MIDKATMEEIELMRIKHIAAAETYEQNNDAVAALDSRTRADEVERIIRTINRCELVLSLRTMQAINRQRSVW